MSGVDSVYVLMLVAGLAGGLGHCSGMCGPLVILLTPREAGTSRIAALHLGRVSSYAVLGGGLAAVASALTARLESFSAGRWTLLAAGVVLLFGGLATVGVPWLRGTWLQTTLGSAPIRRLSKVARKAGPFTLGLFWGFLPCGLLYSAFAAAVGAGTTASHPALAGLRGAAVMLIFGLATTPTLVGISWAARQLPPSSRVWLQRVAGAVVAGSGFVLILTALRHPP